MSELNRGPLALAVIGAGQSGRSLAAAAIRAGHRVLLEDVLPSRLREALDDIPTEGLPGSLELVNTVEDAVREADLVIDFVPDELESKLEIISMVDRMAPPRTILCVPTQTLEISDLASCTYRPDRVVGVVVGGCDVRIVAGAKSSAESIQLVTQFWKSVAYRTEDPS